jgi:ER lumen protein retaining receptor
MSEVKSVIASPVPHVGSYSWNAFRYVADFLHLGGVLTVIGTLARNGSCRGLSFRTQLFYFLVFVTRYLDIFSQLAHFQDHTLYLVLFKLFYIISSAGIVFVMYKWRSTIEANKDTCPIFVIILPCMVIAVVSTYVFGSQTFHNESRLLHTLWTFSEMLEGFAMLPQYIFVYRQEAGDKRSDRKVFLYILLIGSYRCFYAANWIYKKAMLGSAYNDVVSWIGGVVEISLFLDFLFNKSILEFILLSLDTKINSITHHVEMRILRVGSPSGVAPESPSTEQMKRRRVPGSALDEDEAMLMI